MGFQYHHLDEEDVRAEMVGAWLEEWADLSANWPRAQCYGKQLTDAGWAKFEQVMPEALAIHDDDWLAGQMVPAEYLAGHVDTTSERRRRDDRRIQQARRA